MKTLLSIFIAAMALPQYSYGSGIPVYDATAFAKLVEEAAMLQEQIDQMAQAYNKQLEQLAEAKQQTESLTGTRDMGSLLNDSDESAMRYYVPGTLEDLLGNHSETDPIGAAIGTLQDQYIPLTPEEFGDAYASLPGNAAYIRRSQTDHAVIATSQIAYQHADRRMRNYEELLEKLNETEDMKASVDLLARISVENGIIMNELMRLQALQMQQSAVADNHKLTAHRSVHDANQYLPLEPVE